MELWAVARTNPRNRPDRLNAIDFRMPGDIAAAVRRANDDPGVHVIVLQGAGRAFCSGYDLKISAEDGHGTQGATGGDQVWDPIKDFAWMKGFTDDFFTLWRSLKPTIAKVHGHAVAGGSDIALSCDLVVMAEDARIGYMPARGVGLPDHSDVGVSAGRRARQADAADRRHH
jgi:enoyl-CoA hydratase